MPRPPSTGSHRRVRWLVVLTSAVVTLNALAGNHVAASEPSPVVRTTSPVAVTPVERDTSATVVDESAPRSYGVWPSRVAARTGRANLRVRMVAPRGVAASIRLVGRAKATTFKPAQRARSTASLRLRPGWYRVVPSTSMAEGRKHVATAPGRIRVPKVGRAGLAVRWKPDRLDPRLRSNSVTPGGGSDGAAVRLAWSSVRGAQRYVLRRAPGAVPPRTRTSGMDVRLPAKRSTSRITTVTPGRGIFSFSLFARTRNGWTAPSSVTVDTAGRGAAMRPGAAVLTEPPANVNFPSSAEAVVDLPENVPLPPVGAGIQLPVSHDLPAGLVAVVTAHLGGRRVQLGSGSLTDVYSQLDLDIDLSSASFEPLRVPPGTQRTARSAPAKKSCVSGGSSSFMVSDIEAEIERIDGRLSVSIRSGPLGVPVRASIDVEASVRPAITADIDARVAGSCGVKLPKLGKSLIKAKIPLAVLFEPTVEFEAAVTASMPNTRFAVTETTWAAADLGLGASPPRGGWHFHEPSLTLDPKIDSAQVGVKAAGQLTVGLGVLDDKDRELEVKNGAVAGINGYLDVVDANIAASPGSTWASPCVTVDASSGAGLRLVAKAFADGLPLVGEWTHEIGWYIPGAQARWPWIGFPRTFPQGCGAQPPASPDPSTPPSPLPGQPDGATSISAGHTHTCRIKSDGSAWCWGANWGGQLGNGELSTAEPTPVRVIGGGTWTSLAAGTGHTCGIKSDRTAWCWGNDSSGQLGTNSAGGAVPREVAGGGTWRSISTDDQHTCGVKTDGTAWCWGENWSGQLGIGTREDRPFPTQVGTDRDWMAIAPGMHHTCGLRDAGTAWCWGDNRVVGSGSSNIFELVPIRVQGAGGFASITSGSLHACGAQGWTATHYCWGGNLRGQLGDGTTTDRSGWSPAAVSGSLAQMSGGALHTCALRPDHTAWCWGENSSGQLGDGTVSERHVATPVAGGGAWAEISAGTGHSCGIKTDGSAWCWGHNSAGQLGSGEISGDRLTPVQVS